MFVSYLQWCFVVMKVIRLSSGKFRAGE